MPRLEGYRLDGKPGQHLHQRRSGPAATSHLPEPARDRTPGTAPAAHRQRVGDRRVRRGCLRQSRPYARFSLILHAKLSTNSTWCEADLEVLACSR